MHIPRNLKKGDTIGILSTARKINAAALQFTINLLESWGLKVVLGSSIGLSHHQFAGTAEQRLANFQAFLDDENIPVVEIPTAKLKHLLIDVERNPSRVEAANLDFPIIVSTYKNEYYSILDGQHRLVKSVKNKIKKIKCRVLDLENCPEEFKKVFIR